MSDKDAPRRVPWKRIIQGAVSFAIVAGIFIFVMPRLASYGDVWDTISDMTVLEIVTLVLVGLWNLVTYWFVLVAVLPGLRYREAAVVNQASTAVSNTLPAGGAIGVGVTYAMYTSWGFKAGDIALSALVSGIWNNFVKLGMPIIAVALLALSGGATAAEITAAVAGLAALGGAIIVFGMILRSERLAGAVGARIGRIASGLRRLVRRPALGDWGDAALGFRRRTIGLLRRRWLGLTLATLISHTSLYVVLLVTLRHVGVSQQDLGWIEVLVAFAIVRLLSALPVTPGGVGIVEAGLSFALKELAADGGLDAEIVAAVLLFRAVTYFIPIPLGALSYVFWDRNKSWRKTSGDRAEAASTEQPA
jgi:uncharacterized membrane protein YbhN (UPF0104 family)